MSSKRCACRLGEPASACSPPLGSGWRAGNKALPHRMDAGDPATWSAPLAPVKAAVRVSEKEALVERGATEVMDRTGRATGAGPLGHDAAHARRVADLTVYLRQIHAEADLEALGRALIGERD